MSGEARQEVRQAIQFRNQEKGRKMKEEKNKLLEIMLSLRCKLTR